MTENITVFSTSMLTTLINYTDVEIYEAVYSFITHHHTVWTHDSIHAIWNGLQSKNIINHALYTCLGKNQQQYITHIQLF